MKVNITGNELKVTKGNGEKIVCLLSNIALIEYLINNNVVIHFKVGIGVIKCKNSDLYINDVQTTRTNFETSLSSYVHEGLYARIIQSDATYTYIAEAIPGTLASSAAWRVKKIITATGTTTWALGNSNFVHIATNLTGLTYA